MKKIKFIILSLLISLSSINYVNAASATLTVSRSTIEEGSSVTATVNMSSAAAWNITISSSGATSGCTKKFADASSDGNNTNQSFSVTCKSTSTGIINFVMSGDITSSDGNNVKLSDSKSVTVTVPREKSKNNDLKSLSVEGYEITPEFNKKVNEYFVTVPSTVDRINIKATKADSYSSIEGTGEKEIEEGLNTFEIIVTSETGVSKIYKLNVNVEDQNPIEVTIDGNKYTLVKVAKNLVKPELFDETTIKIKDLEIPAFINEVSGYTLVGLKDRDGKIELYIYDNDKYTKYNELKSDSLPVVILKMEKVPEYYEKTMVKINEQEYEGYKTKGSNKILLYALNMATGEKNYYTYDRSEKTLQLFDIDLYEKTMQTNKNNTYYIYGLTLAVVFLFILNILLLNKNKKQKKLINLVKEKIIEPEEKTEVIKTDKKSRKKEKVLEAIEEEKIEIYSEEKTSEESTVNDDFWGEPKRKRKKK